MEVLSSRPTVHPAEWTPERVRSFWDNFSETPALQRHYFSGGHGAGILESIDRLSPLSGCVLDYGCGRGDFLELLCARGLTCLGSDSSSQSVQSTGARLAGRPGFLGAFVAGSPLPKTPDVITLVEVVEHLPPEALPGFLASVASLLSPGGKLLTTSPHREDLLAAEVLCPECACLFHPSQHQASIDPEVMERAAAKAGLRLVGAWPTLFRRNSDKSLRTRMRAQVVERVLHKSAPHLLCALQKP